MKHCFLIIPQFLLIFEVLLKYFSFLSDLSSFVWNKVLKKNSAVRLKKQQNFPFTCASVRGLQISCAHACCLSTCKQHGRGYMFPSGRLGAVSTILFTLWIPRTSFGTSPLQVLQRSPFGVCVVVCLCVQSFSLLAGVCVCVCVVSHGEPAMELKQPRCVCVCVWVCVWVCVCARVQDRLTIIMRGNQRGDIGSPEGVQFSMKHLKNLGRSQNSVKESFSNVCYSLRCCC